MDRFTVSIDEELALEFDKLIKARGYSNRSEAIRDMLRGQIESYRRERNVARDCVANLSYVYNHRERELAERLAHLQHEHHDLAVSTMHAHLDHEQCIETVILRGLTAEVRELANALMAECGVRHGQLNLVSAEIQMKQHEHSHAHLPVGVPHRHEHLKPKN
ncbi:MAG: nickel-responsive transcriptional regulator NikR [Pseudomonadota bacterium]